jgi:PKD repeat protein
LGEPTDSDGYENKREYHSGELASNIVSFSGVVKNNWRDDIAYIEVNITNMDTMDRRYVKKEFKGAASLSFSESLEISQSTTYVVVSARAVVPISGGWGAVKVVGHLKRAATLSADFSATPLSGPSPLRVQLSDLSTGAKVTSWQWEIPGTTWTSTVQHPLVVLSTKNKDGWKVGVKLTVRAGALSSSKTKNGYIIVSPDNVAPTLNSKISARAVGSRVVVKGISSDAGGVSQVVYCLKKCKSYKKAIGTTKWKIRIPKRLFNKRGRLSLKIWAQDAAGNWSDPLSKTLVMG